MARKITIYRVAVYGDMPRNYHFATKRLAHTFIREDVEGEARAEIEEVEVELSKVGVVQALDDLIHLLCANEG